MAEDLLTSTLDLLRRLPPQSILENTSKLIAVLPQLSDDLLSTVDQPLEVRRDKGGREYLVSDYNRDGDSYRSPHSNLYDPPLPASEGEGTVPSPKLRELEIKMNEAFGVYRELYYEGGVCSVYLWDLDEGFAGVVLIKKTASPSTSASPSPGEELEASWDSIHVFETAEQGRSAAYKLTSVVMLYLEAAVENGNGKGEKEVDVQGRVKLGGSMTRQYEQTLPLDPSSPSSSHISNLGKLIEEGEIRIRNTLMEVYFSKTKEVVGELRSQGGLGEERERRKLQGELVGRLRGLGAQKA